MTDDITKIYAIYPDIDTDTQLVEVEDEESGDMITQFHVELETRVRLKHEGEWYLRTQRAHHVLPEEMPITEILERFHKEVYIALLFSKASATAVDPETEEEIFTKDPDQRPEEERLGFMGINKGSGA